MNYEDILKNLNPKEKSLALSILQEYKDKGASDRLNSLMLEDYKEIPITIDEFIDNPKYLGNAWTDNEGHSKLYPYWREKLHKLFPDNIHTAVNNAIFSGARGIGKSEVAVLIALYLMYRIICMKDPLNHFHLKSTEKIYFAFMNIKLDLAAEIGSSKFQSTVKLSPWFLSHGTLTGRGGIETQNWVPPDPIAIIIGSQNSDVLGLPIFYAFFDEISFIRNRNIDIQKKMATDMIDTAIGGMKTRFLFNGHIDAILILASSKRSEQSFLEVHTRKKLETEKENLLVVDEAVWKVKPANTYSGKRFDVALGNKFLQSQIIPPMEDLNTWKEKGYRIISVPVEFHADFAKDIDRALCDFAGISSSEISKYISGIAVNDIVNANMSNPFVRDILEIGNAPDDKLQYYDCFNLFKVPKEMMSKPLFVHLDMSVDGDMTGIAGVWIKGKKPSTDKNNQAKDLFYSLAFSVSIKAPKGRQISFEKNRNFIYWLKEQGFIIKGISTDSFQSYDTGQALTAKGYPYTQISVDRTNTDHLCVPYQYLKSTIYEKRLEMYKSDTLIDELVELERNINTGKVDHPEDFRKDVADALCGAIFNASSHAEEFAYDYGENWEQMLDANKDDPTAGSNTKKQLQVDMDEELKNMGLGNMEKPKVPIVNSSISKEVYNGDILLW